MWLRPLIGFLLAPLVPGVAFSIYTVIKTGGTAGLDLPLGIAAFFGYPVAFILGLPIYLIFQRRRWIALPTYLLAGAVLGTALFGFFFLPPALECATGAPSDSHACLVLGTMAPFAAYSALAAAVAGGAFWLIVRPDKARRAENSTV
jgi:hypothetical protein